MRGSPGRRIVVLLVAALVSSACSSTAEEGARRPSKKGAEQHKAVNDSPRGALLPSTTAPPAPVESSSTARAAKAPRPPRATAARAHASSAEATLKVGYVSIAGNLGAALGLSFAQRDHGPVFQAVVDEVNSNGGIAGRQVVAAIRSADQSDFSASAQVRVQNQACTALTEDERVFMVMGGAVYAAQRCYAAHRTPLFGAAGDDDELRELDPWMMPALSIGHSATRIAGFLPVALRDQGFLTRRIGVVFDDATARSAEQVLIPTLEALGGTVVDRVGLGSTAESFSSGTVSTVVRFRLRDVDRVVFFASGFAPFLLFARAAEAQGYRPRYGITSFDAPDVVQQFVPSEQLRGTVGAGWMPAVDVPDEVYPPTSAERACWTSVNRRLGTNFSRRSVRQNGNDLSPLVALWACESLFLAQTALAPVKGRPIDPAAVQGHIHALGDTYPSVFPSGTSFARGKVDGGKHYAHLSYDAGGCACFRYVSGWLRIP